jgi:hypothetical protein
MRLLCWALGLAFGLLVGLPTASAVDGTFRGKVTDPPANEPSVKGWIFVEGRNHMLRRVEVTHADIVFGEEVPASERRKCNADCLSAGQEVQITAHQDEKGEWRAQRIEILKLSPKTAETQLKARSLPNFTGLYRSLGNVSDESCIAPLTGEI